jgi:hypothetical protein
MIRKAALSCAFLCLTSEAVYSAAFDYGTPQVISPQGIGLGEFQLRFSHRFQVAPASFPSDPAPALNLGLGLTRQLSMDLYTSTRTKPVDAELGMRYQWLDEWEGSPVSMNTRVSYTTHALGQAGSGVGEVTLARNNLIPRLSVGMVGRYFTYVARVGRTTLEVPGYLAAVGMGFTYSLLKNFNLVADFVSPLDQSVVGIQGFNWSTGIQWWIPNTPHVLNLFCGRMGPGNTLGRTFSNQGLDDFRVGFEYHAFVEIPGFPGRPAEDDSAE